MKFTSFGFSKKIKLGTIESGNKVIARVPKLLTDLTISVRWMVSSLSENDVYRIHSSFKRFQDSQKF